MKDLLDLMLGDMEKAHPLFQPTHFWQQCIPKILADIDLFGWENFYAHPSAQDFYAASVAEEHLLRYAGIVDQGDQPPHLGSYSQSMVGRPFNPFLWEGRHLTFTSLNYLRGLTFLKQHADTSSLRHTLEIGGGFGALGEILLGSSADYTYINVDIPPLAALATCYLREVFGKDAVLDYSVTRDQKTIDVGSARAMVLCPWQLPRLQGSVQLAVNFISFQEMEPPVIDHYAAHLKRLTDGPMLLRNSPTGKFLATDEEPLGVKIPATRADYQSWFAPWKLTARDIETYGDRAGDFASEVMIFTPSH